jgi:hypothetical protein
VISSSVEFVRDRAFDLLPGEGRGRPCQKSLTLIVAAQPRTRITAEVDCEFERQLGRCAFPGGKDLEALSRICS